MPSPKDIFQAAKADLEAVGITVVENAVSLAAVPGRASTPSRRTRSSLGWTGDYNTPDNFLGSFFSDPTGRFGTQYYDWGQKLSDDLAAADSEPDAATRTGMYEAAEQATSRRVPAGRADRAQPGRDRRRRQRAGPGAEPADRRAVRVGLQELGATSERPPGSR